MTPQLNWVFLTFQRGRNLLGALSTVKGLGRNEQGFLIPMALVLLTLGILLVVPLLGFVRESLGQGQKTTENEAAYYAADAGIEAVLSDLRQGVDVLTGGYTPPVISLNNYTATVTVAAPPREDMLPFGAVFADPHSGTSLSSLAGKTSFLYNVFNARPLADMQINWAYTPSSSPTEVMIHEGIGTGGVQVSAASIGNSPLRHLVDPTKIKGGTYTIRFYNNSDVPITSAASSTTGEPGKTWLRVTAFKDYLITSTAGPVTLTVFARQAPGPNQISRGLHISTWHGPN